MQMYENKIMEKLPNEILCYIFCFLNYKDRTKLGCLCKRFYNLHAKYPIDRNAGICLFSDDYVSLKIPKMVKRTTFCVYPRSIDPLFENRLVDLHYHFIQLKMIYIWSKSYSFDYDQIVWLLKPFL